LFFAGASSYTGAELMAKNEGSISQASPFPRAWAASVCGLACVVYCPTLLFQFVHDDRSQILGNSAIQSWHAVPGYFTAQVWAAIAPAALGNDYRPVFLLWLRINDAIFGLYPAGWHLTTILAHVLATYCVMLLAQRILDDGPAVVLSGLIFGLHPIHIEGVAWISGVPEPLLACLLIPSYLLWLRWREGGEGSGQRLIASLALYTLGLLTKETAVAFLLILPASEWLGFPRPRMLQTQARLRQFRASLQALIPFFLLTVLYLIMRSAVLKGFSHPAAEIPWLTVVLTWPALLLFYMRLLLWPVGLSPFYGLEYVQHPSFLNTLLPALILALVGLGLWKWALRSRAVALAVPWLIFPVLPVMLIQVFGNGNFAHNRYLYLPSVGFSLLAAAGIRKLRLGRPLLAAIPASQVAVAVALALLLGAGVLVEDRYYASDATFYAYAYSHMGRHDPVIAMDYANTLAEQHDFDHAARIYQEILQAHPGMWDACFNLGYMYYQQGQEEQAAEILGRAAALDPSSAGAVFYLGLADLKLNRMDEAEASLRRAVALAPTTPNYHFALGVVLKVKGNGPAALSQFARELELNPANQAAARQAAEIREQMAGK
jgi:protein O-mannosyl-transferase